MSIQKTSFFNRDAGPSKFLEADRPNSEVGDSHSAIYRRKGAKKGADLSNPIEQSGLQNEQLTKQLENEWRDAIGLKGGDEEFGDTVLV